MKKKMHIIILILLFCLPIFSILSFALLEDSLSNWQMMTNFFGGENQKNIRKFVEQYHQSRTNGVKDRIHQDLLLALKKIETSPVLNFFFNHEPEVVRSIGYNSSTDSDETHRTYFLQYDYTTPDFKLFPPFDNDSLPSDGFYSLILTIDEVEKDRKALITGFHMSTLSSKEKQVNKFNLKGKSPFQIGFLLISVLVPIFILFTLVQFVRMPSPCQKTLWFAFIAFGVTDFTLNWTTGDISTTLIGFNLLGGGFYKSGPYAPWIISVSIPIGALLFYFKRRKWIVDYQSSLASTSND